MTTQTTHRPAPAPVAAAEPARGERFWSIVVGREIMAKLTDKSFLISTLVSLGMIVALLLFQLWFFGKGDVYKVAVAEPRAQQAVAAAAALPPTMPGNKDRVEAVAVADRAAGLAALASGAATALLEPGPDGWTLTYQKDPSRSLDLYLGEAVRSSTLAHNAAKAGVDLTDINRGTHVTTTLVEGDAARAGIAFGVSMVFSILFFIAAIGYGMQIAQSVVEEKQSRIVEILASAIPIPHLLAGKVIGNTVMALGQMLLFAGTGLIGLSFTEFKGFVPALSSAVGWYVAFFLAGFLALACIWAVAGSLASRNEDLQQTTMPLMMILIPAYMAGFFASGTAKVVLSFVPVVSSMLMPVRLFEGTAQWWEALLALGGNLIFAALTIWLGARLYRSSLLQVHGRVKLLDALRHA